MDLSAHSAPSHPAALPIEMLLRDCEITRTRRSGPGGQHRNKVSTAVVVEHRPTGIRGEANETRSQDTNRQRAVQRLRIQLAISIRSSSEATTGTSELWRSRLRGGRLEASADHVDFPALLAEALDVIVRDDFQLANAARDLTVTTSQLIKFLRSATSVWQFVNGERAARGMRPLLAE